MPFYHTLSYGEVRIKVLIYFYIIALPNLGSIGSWANDTEGKHNDKLSVPRSILGLIISYLINVDDKTRFMRARQVVSETERRQVKKHPVSGTFGCYYYFF